MSMEPETAKIDATLCYLTGKPDTQSFIIGDSLLIAMTQEVFAHFILRSKKDPSLQKNDESFQKYNEAEKETRDVLRHIAVSSKNYHQRGVGRGNIIVGINNVDDWINIQMKAIKLDASYHQLRLEKTENQIRILREMKNDYRETGKLSS